MTDWRKDPDQFCHVSNPNIWRSDQITHNEFEQTLYNMTVVSSMILPTFYVLETLKKMIFVISSIGPKENAIGFLSICQQYIHIRTKWSMTRFMKWWYTIMYSTFWIVIVDISVLYEQNVSPVSRHLWFSSHIEICDSKSIYADSLGLVLVYFSFRDRRALIIARVSDIYNRNHIKLFVERDFISKPSTFYLSCESNSTSKI